ncbi:MAG: serine hydrolase [Myxococcota bacterium]
MVSSTHGAGVTGRTRIVGPCARALGLSLAVACSGSGSVRLGSAAGSNSAPEHAAVEDPTSPAVMPSPAEPEPEPNTSRTGEPSTQAPAVREPPVREPPVREPPVEDPWLADLLRSRPKIARLMDDPAHYRFQVMVTVIEPRKRGPRVTEHGYRVDAEYIYPASAIKTFASVGALLVLQDLRAEGHRVGLHTPIAYCEGDSKRCKDEDPSNVVDGTITVGHEIRKMQLVSDNQAFNRLYEVVGHREINERMWALGFPSLRVHHRMYGVHDELAQHTTPRIELRPRRGATVVVPARVSDLDLPPTPSHDMLLGVGYIEDATHSLVEDPLDFSRKNYVSVRDLHRLTMALARPELPGVPDLGLTPAHRKFLLAAMIDDPLESANPVYTNPRDSGLRYHTLIKGMMKIMPKERILYVGKAGRAYGFHLDNAYIEDKESGRAMVVTVVAYANANGVLNDNKYEYDGITRPLLKNMGILLAKAVMLGEAL